MHPSGNASTTNRRVYSSIEILSFPRVAKTWDTTGMNDEVSLRDLTEDDLPILFEHQLDPIANKMAAFTAKDPTDAAGFMTKWRKILADPTVTNKAILFAGTVAGYIASFERAGLREITYWIGRQHWGKGVATAALSSLLRELDVRPLYARAAKDNIASLRVLDKCGFKISGEDKGFANARGGDVDEFVLALGAGEEAARS
jgi:RimJ/RimL family protein N-acetyltransferase